MTNTNDARRAHDVLDGLFAGRILSQENEQLLRSFLPELPKQKTLEEITLDVLDALAGVSGNDWGVNSYNPNISIEDWLTELHAQLKGLIDTHVTVPALPAGMRIAVHAVYGRVVVSPVVDDDGTCKIFHLSTDTRDGSDYCWAPIDSLTFIDYEPAKFAHPEFLETEADYENAPEGTVVASSGRFPWVKGAARGWACSSSTNSDFAMSKIGRRNVLRWGWGK